MQDVCSFWEACVQANEGIPPLCMAHDNHMLQMPLTELFLGLQPLPDLPFLRHCGKGQALPIKCWPFRTLIYKNRWPVFGGNDPAHCQKNAVHALRGLRRQLRVSGFRVVLGTLRLGGLPIQPYRGADSQSDREAAWILNPKLLSSSLGLMSRLQVWQDLSMSCPCCSYFGKVLPHFYSHFLPHCLTPTLPRPFYVISSVISRLWLFWERLTSPITSLFDPFS